jgi:alpha-1,2-rhamnosyltransferase
LDAVKRLAPRDGPDENSEGAYDAIFKGVQTIVARPREREDVLRTGFASWSWYLTVRHCALSSALRHDSEPPSPEIRRPRPTIFIECTHTYHSDLNTGIQRVVRNILRNAPAVAQVYNYDVVPVIVEDEQLRFTDVKRVLTNKQRASPAPDVAAAPLAGRSGLSHVKRIVWRALLRGGAAALPFGRVRAFLYAPPHRPGLARYLKLLRPQRRPAPTDALTSLDDFDRCDGSILLLLDSSWASPIWPGARRFKKRGGMVVGVVYDLIPITHSHTCVPELTAAFKEWIGEHLRWSDAFICISRAVADMLANYIRGLSADESILSRIRIDHFSLGSELDLIEPNDPVRPAIKDIFTTDGHVFLMVGTIEPRKMHAYVLKAFDRLWAQGGTASLVIVGRYSWKTEAFVERVAHHPERGHRLFLLRDATDAELDYCYRSASSLVIASEVEGFGLPVVEAFQRGLPVMCSNIPVFREIADGRAVFFSLSDPANLEAALDEFCRRVPLDERDQRVPQGWIGWRQSTEQLFSAIMRTWQPPPCLPAQTAE